MSWASKFRTGILNAPFVMAIRKFDIVHAATGALTGVGKVIAGEAALTSAGYAANAVHFNGFSTLFADALACTDNGKLSFSVWFYLSAVPTNVYNFFVSDPNVQYNNFLFVDGNTNPADPLKSRIGLELWTTLGEGEHSAIEFDDTAGRALDGEWHHLMGSFEQDHDQGSKLYQVFLDDVEIPDTNLNPDQGAAAVALINGLPMYVFGDGYVGFLGDVADFWLAPGVSLFVDGDIPEATRRLFISAGGKPVDPSGFPASPMLFSGNATGFVTNQGAGGAFALRSFLSGAGLVAPGAVTLTGAAIGQTVISVHDTTTDTDVTASFEAAITVNGQVQQTGVGLLDDSLAITLSGILTNASSSPSD